MKKQLFKLVALVLVLTLFTACSKKETVSEDAATSTPAAATETPAADITEAAEPTAQEEVTSDTEIYVFIAASLNNAMTEIADLYGQIQPNVKITYNADSSGVLQTQIEEGAQCDMFFSAATKQMTALSDEGLADTASIVNLLENKVVLIKPSGTETAVTGFENVFEAKSIALGAESVPAGDYARQVFKNMNIWDKVQEMEINEGSNVTAVLAAVSEGSNEVGVVYATDAASMKDSVEIIAMAPKDSLDSPIIYPVGLVKNPEADEIQSKAAIDFLSYLSSDEALSVFEKYGFSVYNQ